MYSYKLNEVKAHICGDSYKSHNIVRILIENTGAKFYKLNVVKGAVEHAKQFVTPCIDYNHTSTDKIKLLQSAKKSLHFTQEHQNNRIEKK